MRLCVVVLIALVQPIAVEHACAAPRSIHVFVALADNDHQGIVPVPRSLGNGDDANHNLYWGSAYGVRTFFSHSSDWKMVFRQIDLSSDIVERCIFRHRSQDVYLVADAYRGRRIEQAILDFFDAAAGVHAEETLSLPDAIANQAPTIPVSGGADLVAYIGHDGLMDFKLSRQLVNRNRSTRPAIILACVSRYYFADGLRVSGARPLLWTTNLMAPEAYTLKAALDAWIDGKPDSAVRDSAAAAYAQYQKCSLAAARRLFVSGW
jgi:hypothetical protein